MDAHRTALPKENRKNKRSKGTFQQYNRPI